MIFLNRIKKILKYSCTSSVYCICLHVEKKIHSPFKISSMIIEFEKLRRIKHRLPHGSMKKIADELGLKEDVVRSYFGGTHFQHGTPEGVHFEKGAGGGFVRLENTAVLDAALKILNKESVEEVA